MECAWLSRNASWQERKPGLALPTGCQPWFCVGPGSFPVCGKRGQRSSGMCANTSRNHTWMPFAGGVWNFPWRSVVGPACALGLAAVWFPAPGLSGPGDMWKVPILFSRANLWPGTWAASLPLCGNGLRRDAGGACPSLRKPACQFAVGGDVGQEPAGAVGVVHAQAIVL